MEVSHFIDAQLFSTQHSGNEINLNIYLNTEYICPSSYINMNVNAHQIAEIISSNNNNNI